MKFTKIFASSVLSLFISSQVFAGSMVTFSGTSALSLMQAFGNVGMKHNRLDIPSLNCTMAVTAHPKANCVVFPSRGGRVIMDAQQSRMIMDVLGTHGGRVPSGLGVQRVSVRGLKCSAVSQNCSFHKLNY